MRLRPVANAFGAAVGMIATFLGFGTPACSERRSTIACSSGACSGVTTCAREALSASVSDVKYWKNASAPSSTTANARSTLNRLIITAKKTT